MSNFTDQSYPSQIKQPLPARERVNAVAELLALALTRKQQRLSGATVDDALTLSQTRAFIGTAKQRGGASTDDSTDHAAALIAANN